MLSRIEQDFFTKNSLFDYFIGKRILLTGASGFIGGYLLEAINRTAFLRGAMPTKITALTRSGSLNCSRSTYESTNVISVGNNISEFKPNSQFDVVIHAASPASPKSFTSIEQMKYVNTTFIHNLISEQKHLKDFIYFSAGEVYGPDAPKIVNEDYPTTSRFELARSVYPRAKIEGERTLINLADKYNFNAKIIRLFHTYGPGIKKDDGRSISDFFWQVASGKSPELYSDGLSRRSFLFVADLVNAILFILNSKLNYSIYNVGSTNVITVKDFAASISKQLKLQPAYRLAERVQTFEPSPIRDIAPDLTRLKSLGWVECFKLDQGIDITLSWLKTQIQV